MDKSQSSGTSSLGAGRDRSLSHSQSPHAYHSSISSPTPAVDPSQSQSTFSPSFNTSSANTQFIDQSSAIDLGFVQPSSQSQQFPSVSTAFSDASALGQDISQNIFGDLPELPDFDPNSNDQFGFLNTDPIQPTFNDMPMFGEEEPSFDPRLLETNMNASTQPHVGGQALRDKMTSPPSMFGLDHTSSAPQGSPIPIQNAFFTPVHSRHTSLDPASAAFSQGQGPEFRNYAFTHHRTPSEYSDVSSAAPSPSLNQDSFEAMEANRSPLLNPQADFQGTLGMESFTIGDTTQPGISPGHSPFVPPQSMPIHGLGLTADPSLAQSQYSGIGSSSLFPRNDGILPTFKKESSIDMCQTVQMAPPEINVEFAPPAKQPSWSIHNNDGNGDTLNIPQRGRRPRAVSDPVFAGPMSRSSSPGIANMSPQSRPLSPSSRSQSPQSLKSNRRSSTSSVPPSRNYLINLADPGRPGNLPTESKRVQKHPATFQCTLCPKRFTRAYNLRSHLRTHTDERPFVCTVCHKPFARQHDRKRHEGLHTGEKKFVCRGDLASGGQWGCGRRFARADALGRHFRSEAGRVCIKPLLDEDAMAREQQRRFEEQQMQQAAFQAQAQLQNQQFILPSVLLNQYPALRDFQWDAGPVEDAGDVSVSGRSSFDAGSGSRGWDEDEADAGYMSGGSGLVQANGGWGSDYSGVGR